jgi:hypothetical protein
MVYLMKKSVAQTLSIRWQNNSENRRGTDMEVVMEKLEVLSQHLHERTEGNQESAPPRSG